jgi:hypothetical protein
LVSERGSLATNMSHTPPAETNLTLALENQTCSLLAELDKRFQSLEAKWKSRVGGLKSHVAEADRCLSNPSESIRADMEAHLTASDVNTESRLCQIEEDAGFYVTALESAVQLLDGWRPRVDSSIAHLQYSIEQIHVSLESPWPHLGPCSLAGHPRGLSERGILSTLGSAPGRQSIPVEDADGPPFGHRFASQHWDSGFWQTLIDSHSPVKGTNGSQHPTSFSFPVRNSYGWGEEEHHGESSNSLHRMPRLNFPSFNGGSHKLWQSKCEKYFDMYETEPHMWIKVATLQFEGVAARWLQSIKPRLPSLSWRQFCQAIQDRFIREQHELAIRKIFHIKKNSSVQDYVDRFCELIDILKTYEHNTDPLYYTMKFIDGLSVAEPPELFQLKCPSHALEAATHLNRNNLSVPRI